MAIAELTGQEAAGTSAAASVSATYASTPTAGNTLVAFLYYNVTAPVGAISGWTMLVEGAVGAAANGAVSIWAKDATGGESTTVTATATAATVMRLQIYEFSGLAPIASGDGTSSRTSGTTGVTTLAAAATSQLATANANDLLVAAWGLNGTIASPSVDSSFAIFTTTQSTRLVGADRIVSATGTYSPALTWTNSNRAGAVIAALKQFGAAAPAAATGSGSLTLSGSGDARAAVVASGSLDLSATGLARGRAEATDARLDFSASGIAAGRAGGTGALALSASGSPRVAAGAAGILEFNFDTLFVQNEGDPGLTANSAGSGSISLGATADSTSSAASSGSLTLGATAVVAGGAAGSGSLTLGGSGAAAGASAAAGTASLSLSASAAGGGRAAGSGVLEFEQIQDPGYTANASGSGSLTLTASGGGSALVVSTASLTLQAAGAIAANAGGTAHLTLTAAGVAARTRDHERAPTNRLLVVPYENRVYVVPYEDRVFAVPAENRVLLA